MNNKTAAIILVKTGISNSFSNIVDGSGSYYYLDMAYDEDKVLVDYHNNPEQMFVLLNYSLTPDRSLTLVGDGHDVKEHLIKFVDQCLEDYKD